MTCFNVLLLHIQDNFLQTPLITRSAGKICVSYSA